jgi:hypothetical protein
MRLMRTRSYVMPMKPSKSLRAEAVATKPKPSTVWIYPTQVSKIDAWVRLINRDLSPQGDK